MNRRSELSANLATVEARIEAACARAGRDRDSVTLIVITKTYPASDVDLLAELGVRHVGENRHPEAGDKFADVEHPLTWHFVGGLQTNKAAAVAQYADVVHSVDRVKLVTALQKGAHKADRKLDCFVQVRLSNDEGRSGVAPAEAMGVADAIAGADDLRLAGVMAIAPLGADPAAAFAELAQVSAVLASQYRRATMISAGMSGDLEDAIKAGATHLRIGRSVLGARPATG